MRKKHRILLIVLTLMPLFVLSSAFSQDTLPPNLVEKKVTPIRCWFKSDKSFIRLGEIFNLTLTCQLAETEYEKVIPFESALEPSAINFTPFEIVKGFHYPDIRNDVYRFIQFQYQLRLIGEGFLGKEVSIPKIEVGYKFERKLEGQNQTFGSKEKKYILPVISLKVISIVPKTEKDIRDMGNDTFQDVKSKKQIANISFAIAGFFAVSSLFIFMVPFFRFFRSKHKRKINDTTFSNISLLRRMNRELKRIQKKSRSGWDIELVGRVLTVVRIMGSIALNLPLNQLSDRFESRGLLGQLKLRKGLFKARKILISSHLTPEMAESRKNLLNQRWRDGYIDLFVRLNNLVYAEEFKPDGADELLVRVKVILKIITRSNIWVVRKSISSCRLLQSWRPSWI